MAKKTYLLCVMDGFGLNPNPKANAVAMAKKPNFDRLWASCPRTTLTTFGERVGLPEGQMGGSEVGHLNIGAGRPVEQWLLRISRAFTKDALATMPTYRTFNQNIQKAPAVHVFGMYSDGGIHSHADHANLLVERLAREYQGNIFLHIVCDGRDTTPKHALTYIEHLLAICKKYPKVQIATVCGRFYGMDRDKRWERTQQAYDAIALAKGPRAESIQSWIKQCYDKGGYDEFVEPAIITPAPISAEDGIVFFHFRGDRMRQIVRALAVKEFDGFTRTAPLPHPDRVLCFTEYDVTFKLPYLFDPVEVHNHIGEYLSGRGLTQFRIAETEKYPHVTYFFNGGIEKEYPGETRTMIPSPRDVKTYDLKPEMSAFGVCDAVCEAIRSRKYDLVVINYANCDLVGHTGVLEAAVKAVETVDTCVGKMVAALEEVGGEGLIFADHGNCEQMVSYEDGTPHTSHTMYPVPCFMVGRRDRMALRDGGALCDLAPTMLKMMDIPQPAEMTGTPLF